MSYPQQAQTTRPITEADVPMKAIETPSALAEFAQATLHLSDTSAAYHEARSRFTAARERWGHLHEIVLKAQEADNL